MIRRLFLLLFFAVVVFSIPYLTPQIRNILLDAGLIKEEVFIAGTGSMYPTFPKSQNGDDLLNASQIVAWPEMRKYPAGLDLFGIKVLDYKITYGDIIELENEKTKKLSQEKYKSEAGFVKRVIALPHDTIELRDGFVILNGKILDEPYTAKPRSSFGGDFLPDCKVLTVPESSFFVMGDNRKASLDSRFELGLIEERDIHYVLPWQDQDAYRVKWRMSSDDYLQANTVTLEALDFVNVLNAARKKENLKPLRLDSRLSASGKIRGNAMIKHNDFSEEATRSGITLSKAVSMSGYNNIIFAEIYTRGYYEGEELLENFMEFPDTKKILFGSDYQDIGVGIMLGNIEGCPVQVIVVHLGGYVPPNYTNDEIDSWQKLINNLEEVLPSWRTLKEADNIDRKKVDNLSSLLETRLSNAKKIVIRMRANQWLTEEEKRFIEDDKKLSDEAINLMSELNKR